MMTSTPPMVNTDYRSTALLNVLQQLKPLPRAWPPTKAGGCGPAGNHRPHQLLKKSLTLWRLQGGLRPEPTYQFSMGIAGRPRVREDGLVVRCGVNEKVRARLAQETGVKRGQLIKRVRHFTDGCNPWRPRIHQRVVRAEPGMVRRPQSDCTADRCPPHRQRLAQIYNLRKLTRLKQRATPVIEKVVDTLAATEQAISRSNPPFRWPSPAFLPIRTPVPRPGCIMSFPGLWTGARYLRMRSWRCFGR